MTDNKTLISVFGSSYIDDAGKLRKFDLLDQFVILISLFIEARNINLEKLFFNKARLKANELDSKFKFDILENQTLNDWLNANYDKLKNQDFESWSKILAICAPAIQFSRLLKLAPKK